jgi:hypothetical protein
VAGSDGKKALLDERRGTSGLSESGCCGKAASSASKGRFEQSTATRRASNRIDDLSGTRDNRLSALLDYFANRYHKFRKVRGKLFQDRCKSLIVEEDSYLGAFLHYTHLNPARASMTDVAGLRDYRWSSYWYLQRPTKRPGVLDCSGALEAAGGLPDTSYGRKKYAEYLQWLSTDNKARKEMAFEKMCKGWAVRTKQFKKALIEEAKEEVDAGMDVPGETGSRKMPRYDGETLREANKLRWELVLEQCMKSLDKTSENVKKDKKSADWKIMIAVALKHTTSATNIWIADALNMGVPHAVSRYVGMFGQSGEETKPAFQKIIANITP